jgi:hypothetical protein
MPKWQHGFCIAEYDKEGGTFDVLGQMGMEATSLTRTLKINGRKANHQKEKSRGWSRVLIYLTDFSKEKRELSKKYRFE